MVYGFKAMEIDDPHILLAEEMMQITEHAVIAGWAVDFLPFRGLLCFIVSITCHNPVFTVKRLPRWVPGTGFRQKADYIGGKIREMISTPFEEVRVQVVSNSLLFNRPFNFSTPEQKAGEPNESFAAINIKRMLSGSTPEEEKLVKTISTAMYGGE